MKMALLSGFALSAAMMITQQWILLSEYAGYIGTAKNGGNQGRYGDIHDRVYLSRQSGD